MGDISATGPSHEDAETIQKLLVGVIGLIDTLSTDQRAAGLFDFDDPRRLDWDIIPKPDRIGVSLHNLDRHQKVVVHELVRLVVSPEPGSTASDFLCRRLASPGG